MWWNTDNAVLGLLQAACVALPAAGLPAWLDRGRSRAWSLVLPVSLVGTVALIAAVPASADVYTWVALVLVPVGAALAAGWAARPPRGRAPRLLAGVLAAALLLALNWASPETRPGQLAGDLLILGSAVTLGRLLAGGAPLLLLKAGLVLMAAFDAVLVFGGYLEAPNAVLNAAVPAPGLPQLQTGVLGFSSLGYGDFLAAALLGGVLAAERGPQWRAALAVLLGGLLWDQLFLVYDVLPATIPPALVLLAYELSGGRPAGAALRRRRRRPAPAPPPGGARRA